MTSQRKLHFHLLEGVRNITSVCLQLLTNFASMPHSIINGYKGALALSVETEYTFPLTEKFKAFWAYPSPSVASTPMVATTTAAPASDTVPAKVKAKK
jgi:large subunit ribosomal protein LP0